MPWPEGKPRAGTVLEGSSHLLPQASSFASSELGLVAILHLTSSHGTWGTTLSSKSSRPWCSAPAFPPRKGKARGGAPSHATPVVAASKPLKTETSLGRKQAQHHTCHSRETMLAATCWDCLMAGREAARCLTESLVAGVTHSSAPEAQWGCLSPVASRPSGKQGGQEAAWWCLTTKQPH